MNEYIATTPNEIDSHKGWTRRQLLMLGQPTWRRAGLAWVGAAVTAYGGSKLLEMASELGAIYSNLIYPSFQIRTTANREVIPIPLFVKPTGMEIVDGKAKVKLNNNLYCDPLGILASQGVVHPADNLLRLYAKWKVPVSSSMNDQLSDPNRREELFYQVEFNAGSEEKLKGTIIKIFPDGSFLVKNTSALPSNLKDSANPPNYFHVNPESVNPSVVRSGLQLRQLILDNFQTPEGDFDIQRQKDPPGGYSKEIYNIYSQAKSGEYLALLKDIGYSAGYGDRQKSLTNSINDVIYGNVPDLEYLSFEEPRDYFSGFRIADQLRVLGVQGINPGDAVTESGIFLMNGSVYIPLWNALEAHPEKRSRIIKVKSDKSSDVLFNLPGRTLTFAPLPTDDRKLILSSDSLPQDDSRFQATYLVDTRSSNYDVLNFPVNPHQAEGQPQRNQLYGRSIRFSSDGQHMYVLLYGFPDESGGLWEIDFKSPDFPANRSAYHYILSVDHSRKLLSLDGTMARRIEGRGKLQLTNNSLNALITAKEVNKDFSMSAITFTLDPESRYTTDGRYIEAKMAGWNPDPLAYLETGGNKQLLLETYSNYESSIVPVDAFPVYAVNL